MLWKIAKAGRNATIAFAAEELKRYLEQMDPRQEIAIFRFDAYKPELSDKGMLWLGVCPQVSARVPDSYYDDAVDIRVRDGAGAILGSNPRSVLMGVYRLLRELGCAWIRPGKEGEIIPQKSLDSVEVTLSEIPSYRHRGICIEGSVNYDNVHNIIDWMPKVGMNGFFNQFHVPFAFYDRWYSHRLNPHLEPNSFSAEEACGLRDSSVDALLQRGMMVHAVGHGWTCDPFGIPGESWDAKEYNITPEQEQYMAKVNGKRQLWKGVPLITNLCYSNPEVRSRIALAVVKTCQETPELDFVQLWLADGNNNHCECQECVKKRPSDWYIMLLNEVDAAMTAAGLRQKVVFLLYVDLIWAPQQETIHNPERFVLMFAPIIPRCFSVPMTDSAYFDEANLPPYVRNKLTFEVSVGENLAHLRQWQKKFQGDSFDFDYHFMWDHFMDPGYYRMAEVLFQDMQNLHKMGLNGMISCQNQRVFFPTGLGMVAMSAALWDETCSFDKVAADYFSAAFGADGTAVQDYLRRISDAFDPRYLRRELPVVDAAAADRLASIPALLEEFIPVIASHTEDTFLPENVRKSWEYLRYHADYCRLLAEALRVRAEGDEEGYFARREDLYEWTRMNELPLQTVFDMFELQAAFGLFMNR